MRLLLLVLVFGCAAAPARRAASPADAELRALETKRLEALGRADADTLAPLFHRDLVITLDSLVRTGDEILSRQRDIAKTGKVVREFPEELTVEQFGDVAITRGLAITIDDTGTKRISRFTNTWLRSGGKWLLVAGHVTAIR